MRNLTLHKFLAMLLMTVSNASGKVYNLQGVVVGNTTEGLPKGVYIKNGRKIIVK